VVEVVVHILILVEYLLEEMRFLVDLAAALVMRQQDLQVTVIE
jgi:hypothetical protein